MNENEQVQKYLNIATEELNQFMQTIDTESLAQAKQLILDAESKNQRIHITGIGKPGHVAGYIASLLSSTGTSTYELHGTEAVHGSSGQVKPGDVVIAISNSGETKELKATVETLKHNGAKIISVTGHKDSWLAKQGDVVLIAYADKEGDKLNKPPRISILVEIMLLQTLSILLENEKGLSPEKYVKWHPGGALGASIRAGK